MTISILARDPHSGTIGGAAATGSLCVGGWVLRGHPDAGMSASQGLSPSTLWGENALAEMRSGCAAANAIERVTSVDRGRDSRQLSAIDIHGRTAGFTGSANVAAAGVRFGENVVVAGNMLASEAVLDAAMTGFMERGGDLASRFMAALEAAAKSGGDMRGLRSAALLVVSRSMAPLDLRIDYSPTPIDQLRDLLERSQTPPYSDWIKVVPTLDSPERT